jgi:hypothetical protein
MLSVIKIGLSMTLESQVTDYSKSNGSIITSFELLACDCGCEQFLLFSDDNEGGAYVVCTSCKNEHDIQNSKSYIESEDHNICNCENEILNIGIGKSFYPDSTDIKWLYVGASCNECGLAGVYVDWHER